MSVNKRKRNRWEIVVVKEEENTSGHYREKNLNLQGYNRISRGFIALLVVDYFPNPA